MNKVQAPTLALTLILALLLLLILYQLRYPEGQGQFHGKR